MVLPLKNLFSSFLLVIIDSGNLIIKQKTLIRFLILLLIEIFEF